jgi:hypothetical protein
LKIPRVILAAVALGAIVYVLFSNENATSGNSGAWLSAANYLGLGAVVVGLVAAFFIFRRAAPQT